jgi:hypothetical protein
MNERLTPMRTTRKGADKNSYEMNRHEKLDKKWQTEQE